MTVPTVPDPELYAPLFAPWLATTGEFSSYYSLAAPNTLVSPDRCYVLYRLLLQAIHVDGAIWECGVYKGGTAAMMARILRDYGPWKKLFLFDTFEGMPESDAARDVHIKGHFNDTSLEAVRRFVGEPDLCVFRRGFIPDSFAGLESEKIAFAHIDVDLYRSVLDCLEFIWPRLSVGGFMIFDDYGFPSCPGARAAVDKFFLSKSHVPLCLQNGHAVVFKGPN